MHFYKCFPTSLERKIFPPTIKLEREQDVKDHRNKNKYLCLTYKNIDENRCNCDRCRIKNIHQDRCNCVKIKAHGINYILSTCYNIYPLNERPPVDVAKNTKQVCLECGEFIIHCLREYLQCQCSCQRKPCHQRSPKIGHMNCQQNWPCYQLAPGSVCYACFTVHYYLFRESYVCEDLPYYDTSNSSRRIRCKKHKGIINDRYHFPLPDNTKLKDLTLCNVMRPYKLEYDWKYDVNIQTNNETTIGINCIKQTHIKIYNDEHVLN